MKKSDLKDGMIVELRDGRLFVVVHLANELLLVRHESLYPFDCYDDDLKYTVTDRLDVVAVYEGVTSSIKDIIGSNVQRVVWSRKEKEVTMKEVCEKFGCQVKIVEG